MDSRAVLSFTPDEYLRGLAVYCVGGAVRDALLQQSEGDKDWVVVGATPEEMIQRGFIPVGGDFPVFLHPKSKEEYALARTERKSGKGYQGFTFYTGQDVTLEEDLKRRDFTINAMASDSNGHLYDPYGGLGDLEAKVFRHVGDAFIEDPVRILRLGRFLSRFSDFMVAPETLDLCRVMVSNREVDALVPERVWKEVSRALMGEQPARFFEFMESIGALPRVIPLLSWNAQIAIYLQRAADKGLDLSQRYALLSLDSEDIEGLAKALRVAREQADYAKQLYLLKQSIPLLIQASTSLMSLTLAQDIVSLVERLDGIRKSERLLALIQACTVLDELQGIDSTVLNACWHKLIMSIKSVPVGEIAKPYAGDVVAIKQAVYEVRVQAVLSSAQL